MHDGYFDNQTLLDAFADFPLVSLASPRNRIIVDEIVNKVIAGDFKGVFAQATGVYTQNYFDAISGVLSNPQPTDKLYPWAAQFNHNVANLAAWKSHRMATDLMGLKDEKEIRTTIKKYNQWQAVEYNAITSRTRTARQLLDFETRKNIFPNLEWIRTRAANPREQHLALAGLVLPIDHPFWAINQPGNLYGCKCDWKQTSAKASDITPASVTPSPGLDGNPINTGELITRRAGHFKAGNQKIVPAAILQLPDDIAYINLKTKSNIPVKVHIAHGTDELTKNMDVFSQFTLIDENIKDCIFLPKIDSGEKALRSMFYPARNKMLESEKNADAIILFKNGVKWVADMKSLKSGKFRKRMNEGANQGDFLIVRLETTQHNKGFVKTKVDKMIEEGLIKGAVIMDINGNLIYRNT